MHTSEETMHPVVLQNLWDTAAQDLLKYPTGSQVSVEWHPLRPLGGLWPHWRLRCWEVYVDLLEPIEWEF